MLSFRRLKAVAHKEYIHVVRDWRSLFLSITIPMLLMVLYGYALNMDLKDIRTVVWDQSRTSESREMLSMFDGSSYFSVIGYYDSYRDLQKILEKSNAMIALIVPANFSRNIKNNKTASIQVIADGSDANTARLAIGYIGSLGLIYSRNIAVKQMHLADLNEKLMPVEMVPRAWYNPDLRSQNVILPGIIAIVMMLIASMLTSVTVAREWETGTMEQLVSTPVKVPEIIFGKVAPYFMIAMADVFIAVIVSKLIFQVPLRGNAALLFCMAALFLTGALFFGMVLSIVMKTQVLANQMALVGGFLPTMLLSGFVFPIENMPFLIQMITYVVPARYFITILRGIYLKGIGLEILWLEALLMLFYAAIMVIVANKRMKLKLD